MTRQETEQIIKEAVEQTFTKVTKLDYRDYRYEACSRDDICVKDLIVKNYLQWHWREYFLSHEFCKEWFGETCDYCMVCLSQEPFCDHMSELNRRPYKHHLQQLVLRNSLAGVAQYLKDNPTKHGK